MDRFPYDESIIDGVPAVWVNGRWVPIPRGGADEPVDEEPRAEDEAPAEGEGEGEAEPTPPAVPEGEAIQEADEDTLRALHAELEEWRGTRREQRDVDGVRWALAEKQRIVDEINRRREDARRTDEELAALDEQEGAALPEAMANAAPAKTAGAGASAAQLAAARGAQAKDEQQPAALQPRPKVALLASAGTEIVPTGVEMSLGELGAAIDRAKQGADGRTILASVPGFEEMRAKGELEIEVLSNLNGVPVNDRLMREAQDDWRARERAALTASMPEYDPARMGAICQPYDIIREIPDAFVTDTPVADIFPARPAGRGGFQFTPSGNLSDVLAGVRIWTEADQAALDPTNSATWKPCVEYTCPTPTSAVLEAITTCVTFPITLEMSNPERVANLNNAVNALEARIYEGRVLQRIDQLSSGYYWSGAYGALPSFIEAVNNLVAQLTYANRQQLGNYVCIVPPGLMQVLAIDRGNKGFNPDDAQEVRSILASSLEGVSRIVESLDASLSGQPGVPFAPLAPVGNQGAAMGSPDYLSGKVFRIRLVDPSAAIFAETGEINAGVLRDSTFIRTNRSGYFRERFFFVAKNGPQPWATIDAELCADGARAGLLTPDHCLVS